MSRIPTNRLLHNFQRVHYSLQASITPDNSKISIRFDSSGLNTSTGYAILNFALFEDGEQALPTIAISPATSGPISFASSLYPPEQFGAKKGKNLLSAKNITAQLWVNVTLPGGQVERTGCFQSRLRSDDESGGGSDLTSSTDAGTPSHNSNLTGDDNGSDGASDEGSGNPTSDDKCSDGASDEESGASVPQIAFSLVLLTTASCFL